MKFSNLNLFLQKFVFLISKNIYFLIFISIPFSAFCIIPLIFINLFLVAILFQNLYLNRNTNTKYPFVALDILIALSLTYMILFLNDFIDTPTYLLAIPELYLLLRFFMRKGKTTYLNNSKLAFLLLFLAFVFAWFSSGVLSYVTGYVTNIQNLFNQFGYFPISNPLYLIVDFLSVFATITASPWFMLEMGVWLGSLAFFRLVEVNKIENKVRIFLMILAYFVYSIWLPSFSPIANGVEYIPYMWFNGFGTYGPVEPSYLIDGILGTYIVTAILSFLFGSRQVCSVTCTAPFMLQGTFQDSMKKYNRISKLGKKTLTSKMSNFYKILMIIIWGSLIIFAILSYLNFEKIINFTILGNDPTVFYSSLYFNVIWYLQFVTMPFLGNYSCVTSGLCAWGSFNQFFGYLGLFKLKVKDPKLCLNCRSVDCATACPVGLTDMRASFIKKGEFKAFKCVGVGDCIEACPHDNIVTHDIRNIIQKFSRKFT